MDFETKLVTIDAIDTESISIDRVLHPYLSESLQNLLRDLRYAQQFGYDVVFETAPKSDEVSFFSEMNARNSYKNGTQVVGIRLSVDGKTYIIDLLTESTGGYTFHNYVTLHEIIPDSFDMITF